MTTIRFIGPHTLFLGDCLDILPIIGQVDCVVTDPAYKVISGGSNTGQFRAGGILEANDGKIFEHNDIPTSKWLPATIATMRDPSHAYFMTNLLNLEEMMATCRACGLDIHNLLVWKKNNATPNRWYMKNVEFTIFARRGAAFTINNPGSKMCFEVNSLRDRLHPTQKPVALMREYVENSTQPGETVLDPFMGAGSTGCACAESGRRFIGIEKDPVYFEAACERLEQVA